jgi:hypothetical protein
MISIQKAKGGRSEGATYKHLLDPSQLGFRARHPRGVRTTDRRRHRMKLDFHLRDLDGPRMRNSVSGMNGSGVEVLVEKRI